MSFILPADDDVTSELPSCGFLKLSVKMEDLWCVAVSVFQVWLFVVVFLIMLPAMFGLSLGVTGVYIQILVKILEVTETDSPLSDMSYLSLAVCNPDTLSSGEPMASIHSLLNMFVQL